MCQKSFGMILRSDSKKNVAANNPFSLSSDIIQEVTTMRDLQFQESQRKMVEVDVPRLQSFYGPNVDQMPLLLADGRLPLTPKQLLQERVHGENGHDRNLLRDNYVDTAFSVITDTR